MTASSDMSCSHRQKSPAVRRVAANSWVCADSNTDLDEATAETARGDCWERESAGRVHRYAPLTHALARLQT